MWITHGNGERISGITSSCVIFHFLTAQCINLLPGTDLKTLTDKTKNQKSAWIRKGKKEQIFSEFISFGWTDPWHQKHKSTYTIWVLWWNLMKWALKCDTAWSRTWFSRHLNVIFAWVSSGLHGKREAPEPVSVPAVPQLHAVFIWRRFQWYREVPEERGLDELRARSSHRPFTEMSERFLWILLCDFSFSSQN